MHVENVLDTDFIRLRGDGDPLRIVGNLPYNISTPLLFRLLTQRAAIADMHFMLQRKWWIAWPRRREENSTDASPS